MSVSRGIQFFMHPGPTNIPERVRLAMARPAVDFTGPEFVALRDRNLERMKAILKTTKGFVITYAASGNGAWDASVANLFSPGDKVLVPQTGFFADRWAATSRAYGLEVELVPTPERRAVDPEAVARHLAADTKGAIKAVMLIQNETATGIRHPVAEVRAAMNRVGHPALYLVDTISSLASYDFRMDEWGVDLAVSGSQKGFMLPTGLAIVAVSQKALAAHKTARCPRCFFDFADMMRANKDGYFPYTPATTLLRGLRASLDMLLAEGLDNVYARHRRLAEGARLGVAAWGLKLCAKEPRWHSDTVTAACVPAGFNSDDVVKTAYYRYRMSLGVGLSKVAGKVFRIGHIGNINELMILQALAGCEMALRDVGVPVAAGSGVAAAQEHFRATAPKLELGLERKVA